MKVTRMAVLLAAALMVLYAGCGSTATNTRNPVIETDSGKDYATIKGGADLFKEGGRGSLTINNQASFDIVIYAGKVTQNNVLGGIRAGKSRTFDLTTLRLPSKNGSFLIRAASFAKYSRNNMRVTEEDVLYAGLVVYDLRDSGDKINLNIYAGINGEQDTYLFVSNNSKFVLELRLDNPNGEKLATLAPLQVNKKVYLKPLSNGMPHQFFATYVYIDPKSNEVKSFVAKDLSERQRRIPRDDRDDPVPIVFAGPKNTSEIAFLVSFFRLKNDTSESLNFMDGGRWIGDQKGMRLVESGRSSTFELAAMSGGDQGQLYTNLNMEFDSTKTLRINRFNAKPGVVYDCIVTIQNGNPAYDIRETGFRDKLEEMRVNLFLGD